MAITRSAFTTVPELDGRTREGKRFEQIRAELAAKFGPKGAKNLADQIRINIAAALILRCEELTTAAASGAEFDPEALAALSACTVRAIGEAAPPDPGTLQFAV
jgi:hypothetical protein